MNRDDEATRRSGAPSSQIPGFPLLLMVINYSRCPLLQPTHSHVILNPDAIGVKNLVGLNKRRLEIVTFI
jgi:hypothetical protein